MKLHKLFLHEASESQIRLFCLFCFLFLNSWWKPYFTVPLTRVKCDAEEQLCIVKFVLCVGFADRVGIGEGVQVGKQVEPRWEIFGRPFCLCKKIWRGKYHREKSAWRFGVGFLVYPFLFSNVFLMSWLVSPRPTSLCWLWSALIGFRWVLSCLSGRMWGPVWRGSVDSGYSLGNCYCAKAQSNTSHYTPSHTADDSSHRKSKHLLHCKHFVNTKQKSSTCSSTSWLWREQWSVLYISYLTKWRICF